MGKFSVVQNAVSRLQGPWSQQRTLVSVYAFVVAVPSFPKGPITADVGIVTKQKNTMGPILILILLWYQGDNMEARCAKCNKVFLPYHGQRFCSKRCKQNSDQEVFKTVIVYNKLKRFCLHCGKKFVSEGAWNRICCVCKRSESYEEAEGITIYR